MITQKLISLKIDTELLENLDSKRAWKKRNWCINQAISYYLEIQELRKLLRNAGEDEKKSLLEKWLLHRIPEGIL